MLWFNVSLQLSLGIVMPAYNASAYLEKSLGTLIRCAEGAPILVVNPASTDDTMKKAESLGARVISLPAREGPAGARNAGVQVMTTDIVVFIDADCVVKPDTLRRIHAAFSADPQLVSLTGSYCDQPPAPGFFSQYMNLRHHYTHHQARRENAGFWAGCGAVRRDMFLAAGGFDAQRFPRPMIEDIELGLRLAPYGRMALDPQIQVTHLKAWTGRGVITTDIFCRAIPWTRLIREGQGVPNDLNLRISQRVAALIAPAVLLSPLVFVWGLAGKQPILILGSVLIFVFGWILNAGMTKFFFRTRGFAFALGGLLFHQIHLIYSAATFVFVTLLCARTSRTKDTSS